MLALETASNTKEHTSRDGPPILKERDLQVDGSGSSLLGAKFLLICLLLGLLKLWLISTNEIVAVYHPHDALWYLHSAKEWYWFGPFSEAPFGTPPFIRLPAYPLFIALVRLTGIPLRISIELMLLIAALVFSASLIKAGQSRIVAILIYTAIIFHPLTFQINNHALSDSFYAPVLLFALAVLIILLLKRDDVHRLRYALLAGGVLAVLWHVRQESIIILGLLLVYGLMALSKAGLRKKPWLEILRQLGATVLVPTLVVFFASLTVKTINYAKFGVFAADAVSAPGFTAARTALLRIQPMPPIRYVAFPREVRQRAYRVSPAFRESESYLEGPPGRIWASFGSVLGMNLGDEINTGYFLWAMKQAATEAGYNKSERQQEEYFQRVANEINAACDDRRLQCRWVFSSLLDPHYQSYLPYLPWSFRRITSQFVETYGPANERDEPALSPVVRDIFDEMANRRTTVNTPDSETSIEGWAIDFEDTVERVIVRDQAGHLLAADDQLTPRPDLIVANGAQGNKFPLNSGYHLQYPSTSVQSAGVELVFITHSGKELVVSRNQRVRGVMTQGPLTYAVDLDETFVKSRDIKAQVQWFIGSNYARVTKFLTYLGLAALLVLVVFQRFTSIRDLGYTILILLVTTVLIRVGLFTLIDASSYYATDPRYLFPVIYLYLCILLLLISKSIGTVASVLSYYKVMERISFRKIMIRKA